MKEYVYAHTQTRQTFKVDKKITSKQWQVYYYLLSISYYNAKAVENHRYVYKKDINISAAAKFLGISRPTIYNAISNLISNRLIAEDKDGEVYYIYAKNWTKIDINTLKCLLSYSKIEAKGIDLLRIYLILKKINEVARESKDRRFTKRDLVEILGHNVTTAEDYNKIRDYLAILTYFELIELKHHTEHKEGLGNYVVYHIQQVNDIINNSEEFNLTIADMSISIVPDYIREKLEGI